MNKEQLRTWFYGHYNDYGAGLIMLSLGLLGLAYLFWSGL